MATCSALISNGRIAERVKNARPAIRFLRVLSLNSLSEGQTRRHFVVTKYRAQSCTILTPVSHDVAHRTCLHGHERYYCAAQTRELDELTFHAISDETIYALMEYFEELGDLGYFDQDYDIECSDGVLTVKLGGNHGTYVINKQTPNRQLWLSSPTSGPKRYNFSDADRWIYPRDSRSLHELLSDEISEVTGQAVSFIQLQHGGGTNFQQN